MTTTPAGQSPSIGPQLRYSGLTHKGPGKGSDGGSFPARFTVFVTGPVASGHWSGPRVLCPGAGQGADVVIGDIHRQADGLERSAPVARDQAEVLGGFDANVHRSRDADVRRNWAANLGCSRIRQSGCPSMNNGPGGAWAGPPTGSESPQ